MARGIVLIPGSLQCKYTSEVALSSLNKNYYGSFRKWLADKYASKGRPCEEEWADIIKEDDEHAYGDAGESASLANEEECEIEEEIAQMSDEHPLILQL